MDQRSRNQEGCKQPCIHSLLEKQLWRKLHGLDNLTDTSLMEWLTQDWPTRQKRIKDSNVDQSDGVQQDDKEIEKGSLHRIESRSLNFHVALNTVYLWPARLCLD